ncbi:MULTISPECIES: DNA gyrase inhibitor YacG [Methylobacterium]|uniref:DNA gyrase inhibitor YacG n=1 Tax=Methylobacterium jeotgali TaxID=381630 RepID=A0ABQ4SQQ1_9HYPH|nr:MULTISPECIES: DNA gyrase inhibitor YacG [Methylobacterium]PIU08117.1 MAG: DNA gyrase inhibitor YacG [Methylobacterium sp. CG09_land_8_20_14_0_10_71_15]PIU11138.1 MAG: DNA gyrase inhibitor YacG [Methylobacterium sp. CG08_land_8_20_14_0_20_71_15]GBU16656.1 hypothetical protein AwMethylo_08710 [Methylobacterium sp.]GJE05549.1 DNA gyrase inhibitor YacG [Methylobacterium jeotgali]
MTGARTSKPGCPICGRPTLAEVAPFCSTRCADVDLGRWLNERYAIPGEELDGDSEPSPQEPADSSPNRR